MEAISPRDDDCRREGFFGLIAPLGVDLEQVIGSLKRALAIVGYSANQVKLTDIFAQFSFYNVAYKNQSEKYKKYIAAGDKIRKDTGRDDILALYSIAKLLDYSPRGKDDLLPSKVVHIFRQIKRVEEIKTYKEVFGRNILFVACYTPKEQRKQFLMNEMRKHERGTLGTSLESKALAIIAKDEDEREDIHGQRMMECYPHADFVLDCSTLQNLNTSAERLVEIYFGHPFKSPSRDEYASYIANAASYRSLDLSRQVGAAIFSPQCEVIALGCNEVPKAGGGTYWSDADDYRDYAVGYDSNQKVRDDMTRDALERLQKKNWLSSTYSNSTPDDLVVRAFGDGKASSAPLKDAMIRDVIEYGRMVHAEMNALSDAARFGRRTKGATLYCTTMPCHMCAKLIVAAGIRRVVYVQPYTKSLVEELYPDSISVDQKSSGQMVRFESLKGVTPNGFRIAFRKTSRRKDDSGKALEWDRVNAEPTFRSTFAYYASLEGKAVGDFRAAMERLRVKYPEQVSLPLTKATRRSSRKSKSGKTI